MLRNLTANLITHERIETTDAKAKELRRVAERLISKATRLGKTAFSPQAELSPAEKARRLHVSRAVSSYIPRWGVTTKGDRVDLVEKVLINLAKRFEGRPGGYTRIVKLGPRRGDNAPICIIEFVDVAPPVDPVAAVPTESAPVAAVGEPTGAATTTTEAPAGA
jgi:large subunit ribosomal protein L17